MALILKKSWEAYQLLFEELPDPRMKNLPLLAKPYEVITLLTLYLMFVLKWGPKWMEKRPPFNIDKVLIIYNLLQVLACSYLFVASAYVWGWKYKWICEPVDFSYNDDAIFVTRLTYLYFILKLLDLMDTVFFVLRKKFNQVSFLHLYHHTGMVLLVWGANTYIPGGHGTFIGVINSFVHSVMYFYYFLTVVNPSYKQSIWWKKHITQLQILQFFWCVVHMGIIVFKPDCEYPRWTSAVFLPQDLFMLVLFVDFYIKTYIKKPKAKLEDKNDSNSKYVANGSTIAETAIDSNSIEDSKKVLINNENSISYTLEDKCEFEQLSNAILKVRKLGALNKPNNDKKMKEDKFKNGNHK
ncbi:elongation of very long chain fatty acids protein 7-like [Bombyx mandarina]|uniref:Elongation of very long chain fatty acids protein n=1 Tax=Bombyx mandarina TaxID=7092 RepID=A0A6J2JB93_BOMMA|nr:elongation of very long chain fatty acids protein 7-like [Bombyx mandarina]